MLNRTIQFFGKAYGEKPVQIIATVDDVVMFSGPIPTVNDVPPTRGLPESEQEVLFTIPLNVKFHGILNMSIEVASGTCLILGVIKGNYNPQHDGTTTTATEFGPVFNGDARSSVRINGILQPLPERTSEELRGTWSWTVPWGCTFSHILNIA